MSRAVMVECGREGSVEAQTFGVIDERSVSNARWTTPTDVVLEVGDTINLFIETIFNTEQGVQYHGHTSEVPGEIIETQIKVIVI